MSEEFGTSPRHSPLEQRHLATGATFIDFAGWHLPLRFSSELVEHRFVRSSMGLFDISHMGQLSVTGAAAGFALAASVVSDVSSLDIGRARYTMLCNTDGGVLDDLIVYRLGNEQYLVIANAANTSVVFDELTKRCGEFGVEVVDQTEERALLSLQGPLSADLMTDLLETPRLVPIRFGVERVRISGIEVLLARTGYTGEDGFELSVGLDDVERLWTELIDRGGAFLRPVGLAARDSLRMEAGLPLYGHELSTDRNPIVAGFSRIVDLDHDFVGRDALVRVAADHDREHLVGLVADGQRSPRDGCVVFDLNDGVVGFVTSGGPSPSLGKPIAMAYVRPSAASPEQRLLVDVRRKLESVTVVKLPFLRGAAPTRRPSSGVGTVVGSDGGDPA